MSVHVTARHPGISRPEARDKFRNAFKISLLSTTQCAHRNTNEMAVFVMRAASRTIFRRPYLPTKQQVLSKRHNTTTSTPTTTSTKPDDPAKSISIPVANTVGVIPIWQRLGPLSRGFQAYGRSQRKRPLATQFVSSLVIFFLGDISAQSISGDEYDYKRTLRALVISAGSSIPSYKWYVQEKSLYDCQIVRKGLTSSIGSCSLTATSTTLPKPSPSLPKLLSTRSSLRRPLTHTSLACNRSSLAILSPRSGNV